MFILGHAGIGKAIADRLSGPLPVIPLLLGTLLPDLIDKPLYYAHLWPFITSTRSFGHTGLFLLCVAGIAWWQRSPAMKAVVVGMLTHMVLDVGMDAIRGPDDLRPALIAPLWPLLGVHFWVNQAKTIGEHLLGLAAWQVILGELVGVAFLAHAWHRDRRKKSLPRSDQAIR